MNCSGKCLLLHRHEFVDLVVDLSRAYLSHTAGCVFGIHPVLDEDDHRAVLVDLLVALEPIARVELVSYTGCS